MPKRTYDITNLGQVYEEAKKLFLRGKHDVAIEGFKAIYALDVGIHDVAEIVEDSYDMPKDKWIAKYDARFRAKPPTQPPKRAGDDPDAGSALPVPKRPIVPGGSFRAERRSDEDD